MSSVYDLRAARPSQRLSWKMPGAATPRSNIFLVEILALGCGDITHCSLGSESDDRGPATQCFLFRIYRYLSA